MKIFTGAMLFSLLFYSCYSATKLKAKQGVEGKVYRVAGNQMPSPDVEKPAPKGVETTLYFYELTDVSQASSNNQSSFYTTLSTKFIQQVQSSANGIYKINLPVGKYSVFTKKDSLFYANTFDQHNNIAPVEVLEGKMTHFDVRIDYSATN